VFSAANAAKDHLHDWFFGGKEGEFVSMGVYSDGTSYDIPEGLIYSFPIKATGNFKYEIVKTMTVDDFSK